MNRKRETRSHRFFHLESCVSTQDTAHELSLQYQMPVVVLADHQVQGRGRRGREWKSDRGSLLMSLSLSKNEAPELLSLLAGATLLSTLGSLSTDFSQLTLKWPNDLGVFAEGEFRKVAGILVESKKNYFLIGWGINIHGKAPWPGALSLEELSDTFIDRIELSKRLANNFYQGSRALRANVTSHESFHCDLLEFLNNKGMRALWKLQLGRNWQGHIARGLAGDGSLITSFDGKTHLICSGEI